MSKVGLLTVGSAASKEVVARLADAKRIKAARVHPVSLLMALKVYRQGHGMKGSGQWETVPAVTDALDAAFYTAFEAVEPTGKRFVLGIDVSGSMSWATVAGTPLTACEAATAMAMVTVATEDEVSPMAFADNFRKLPLSRRMSLADAMKHTQAQNFGGTDCALPMLWAAKNKVQADVFVVYTDNETWFGNVHPFQALQEYRQKTGIAAKLVVVGMCANRFTIADPTDPGMLDVVGFDTAVPQAMREFALA
jgi:60 kDa SS-A/Ro ribonucleoprotein